MTKDLAEDIQKLKIKLTDQISYQNQDDIDLECLDIYVKNFMFVNLK